MASPIIWTDEADALLLQEFDRLGSFVEATNSLRAAGFACGQSSVRNRFRTLRPDEYEARSRKHASKPLEDRQEIEIVRLLRGGMTGVQIMRDKEYTKSDVSRVRRKYGLLGERRRAKSDKFIAPATPVVLKKKQLYAYYNGQRAPVSHADHFPKFDRVCYEVA